MVSTVASQQEGFGFDSVWSWHVPCELSVLPPQTTSKLIELKIAHKGECVFVRFVPITNG